MTDPLESLTLAIRFLELALDCCNRNCDRGCKDTKERAYIESALSLIVSTNNTLANRMRDTSTGRKTR